MLLAALVLGLIVGVLFIFPNTSFFGAKAVNERDTQIIYRDESLAAAFQNRKFILDSKGTQIEVKMSNEGYKGEGTIVVNESATGIAFNSLSRTRIEWTQTLYQGELYYRLKVLEPTGVVFNHEPTKVYILLPHCTNSTEEYDFVLQNQYSTVNFSFVDPKKSESDIFPLGNLVVESAAKVNIPNHPNISVRHIEVKSNKTELNCKAPVANGVKVTGSNGSQTFNALINGDVTVEGNGNTFRADKVTGAINFTSQSGSLSANNAAGLTVATKSANINVGQVDGKVIMTTQSGNLSVGKINADGLSFIAGTSDNPSATAKLSVNQVVGNIVVENYGTGTVNLSNVNGDVNVSSHEVGGGAITVNFDTSQEAQSQAHRVTIMGYDGNITVTGINGQTNINVLGEQSRAAAANVTVRFTQVVGENKIMMGGYIIDHSDWGKVTIELLNQPNFDLYVFGARSARSSSKYGYVDDNMKIIKSGEDKTNKANPINGGGAGVNNLEVYSQNTVYLK